jgi:hypothetical protein
LERIEKFGEKVNLLRASPAKIGRFAAVRPRLILASTMVVLLARTTTMPACRLATRAPLRCATGRLRQLTRDNSLVQEMFDTGAISAAEAGRCPAANIITRAVGAETLELDKVTDRLRAGFLLRSAGVFKTLPDELHVIQLGERSLDLGDVNS